MSSSSPPYPYYNGIPYNPSYFTSSTGTGLTQTQANGLYLQKTATDTATALETFSAGIVTNSITSTVSNTLKLNESNNRNTWINSQATAFNYVYIGTAGLTTNYIYGATEINTLGISNTVIGGSGGGYVSLVSGTVFINANGNGNTTIGTSGGSGTVTINRPITVVSLNTNGAVYSNAGLLTNTNPSDETLKKNIRTLNVSIDELNPVEYEWNNPKMGVGVKYGFLANEVVEIFPNICSSWETDKEDEADGIPKIKLGMDTVSLIPIMISSMKKMKLDYDAKLSKLEERLLALETKPDSI